MFEILQVLAELKRDTSYLYGSQKSNPPGTDIKAYFKEEILLGIVIIAIRNFILTPLDIWEESWGHPPIPMGNPSISKARD